MRPLNLAYLLALLNLSTVLGSRMLVALYALQLGAQPVTVGALAATFSAFPMVLAWLAGRLSDRFGARWLVMFGAGGSACGMLVPYLVPGLLALYIAAAMIGLSFTFFTVSLQNLVGILGKPEERARNFSNFAMVAAFASFLGPLIAGFSIDHLGFGVACLILVLLSVVPIVLLLILGATLPGGNRPSGPPGKFKDMLADSNVRKVLVVASLVQLGIDVFLFYMPIYGHAIGLSATAIGVVLAMFAGASFVVRIIMPRLLEEFDEETVLAWTFHAGAAILIVMPFFQDPVWLALLAFLFGLGMGCGPPITMMLTYSQSPDGRSGEALGLRFTANHLARVVGPLVFGAIGSAFGLFPVFWVNALLMSSGGLISRRRSSKGESRPR